jgi:hypothetical protein
MATARWVAAAMVVVRWLPFQFTATPGTKLLPMSVMSVLPEPRATVVTELEERTSAEF